jgi:hypothetical protein
MQFLKVELGLAPPRAYTYAWGGGPIERGEYVVVPPNSYNPNPAIGRVLRVMQFPDFTGSATVLRHKAEFEIQKIEVLQGKPYSPPAPDDVL